VEEPVKKDNHVEKWSGYFKDEVAADKHLRHQISKLFEKYLIVSAKKELVINEKHNKRDVVCHGLYLFKFTVVTANKQNVAD